MDATTRDGTVAPPASARLPVAWLLALTVMAAAARWATVPHFPESVDALYFERGVVRYSLAELRPHWPGYPVYIGVARLARLLWPDPLQALHAVSVGASVLLLWPIAALAAVAAGPVRARRAALFAAAAWAVTPGSWLVGSQVYSDPLGLLLAASAAVLAGRAVEQGEAGPMVAAALACGTLLGVRLAYAPLLVPLAWAVWRLRSHRWRGRIHAPAAALLGLALPVLAWGSWQIAREGSGLLERGRIHLEGHRSNYGRTVETDRAPLTRPLRLAATTLAYGVGGPGAETGALRVAVGGAWILLGAAGLRRLRAAGPARSVLVSWALPYAAVVVLAHDVDFPRYTLPLLLAWVVVAAAGLPEGRAGSLLAAATLLATLVVTVPLARAHQREPPVAWALRAAVLARGADRTAVIVTPDLPAVTAFLADVPGLVLLETDDVAGAARRLAAQREVVWATAPDPAEPGRWRPAAHYTRRLALDPRGPANLWIYERVGSASRNASMMAPGRLEAIP